MNVFQSAANVSQVTFSNSTAQNSSIAYEPSWTIQTVVPLLTGISGILTNAVLLYIFCKNPSLRTPFNIYLINLLSANLVISIFVNPMLFLASLNGGQWILGNRVCTLYLYNTCVIEAGTFHIHVLIALNRMWAIIHPVSYRSRHSRRTAVLLCVGLWCYVTIAAAPEVILDAMYYRLPVDTNGCFVNTAVEPLRTYDIVAEFVFFHLPHLVMLLALAVICFAQKARRNADTATNSVAPGLVVTRQTGTTAATPHRNVNAKADPNLAEILRAERKKSSQGMVLLVLLTVSVTVCWGPIDVYDTLIDLVDNYSSPVFMQVAFILYSLQMTVDPILFTLAVKDLREAFRRALPF